jgi:hypothetical protein
MRHWMAGPRDGRSPTVFCANWEIIWSREATLPSSFLRVSRSGGDSGRTPAGSGGVAGSERSPGSGSRTSGSSSWSSAPRLRGGGRRRLRPGGALRQGTRGAPDEPGGRPEPRENRSRKTFRSVQPPSSLRWASPRLARQPAGSAVMFGVVEQCAEESVTVPGAFRRSGPGPVGMQDTRERPLRMRHQPEDGPLRIRQARDAPH